MGGHPSAGELIAVVREFVAGLVEVGALTGRDAFHARVAANALAIVERELATEVDRVEVAALRPFASSSPLASPPPRASPPTLASSPQRKPGFGLKSAEGMVAADDGGDGPSGGGRPSPGFRRGDGVETLAYRADLSAAIRAGILSATTPGLLDALIVATCARLAVDNPRYPTLARLDPGAAPQR